MPSPARSAYASNRIFAECQVRLWRTPYRAWLALLLAFAFALPLSAHAAAARRGIIHGSVSKVRDGDTLQLLTDDGRRIEIRLNAIDAPERQTEASRAQPFAHSSRMHLMQLAIKRRATFEQVSMDRYGRHVGTLVVETPQGHFDAGLWQVEGGMAWVYTRYLRELPPRLRETYLAAEKAARAQQRGLWQDRQPMPPWEWRQKYPRAPNPGAETPRASKPSQQAR